MSKENVWKASIYRWSHKYRQSAKHSTLLGLPLLTTYAVLYIQLYKKIHLLLSHFHVLQTANMFLLTKAKCNFFFPMDNYLFPQLLPAIEFYSFSSISNLHSWLFSRFVFLGARATNIPFFKKQNNNHIRCVKQKWSAYVHYQELDC